MKEIHINEIIKAVSSMVKESNFDLGCDVEIALVNAAEKEESPIGKNILQQLIENQEIARQEQVPICQDTGFAVFYIELGQDVHVIGGNLNEAINEGVRRGYEEGYLRKSIVRHPFDRVNTGDNTPAIIYVDIVDGENLKIRMVAKGGGSENMSFIKMLKPADGIEGAKKFIIDCVILAGSNPCPPIIVGVGIGGTFEKAACLAKKSLFRKVGQRSELEDVALLEEELLLKINRTGIGPQGLGGNTTALDVHIEIFPTHIATLPVAVNINCHASRQKEIIL